MDALKSLKHNTQKLAIRNMIPENILNDEPKNKINKIKEIEKPVDTENLVYRAN